ncbi:hypothetical protein Tco_1016444 [Tanacetum coccineum]|uniref:Uncharacterized protein n=1 Tax=Tanacetum coccineum TaxID=301880 RepID=A0ABQ5FP57_9ASTR
MASMNTKLNIENLDGNIVQKHEGSKQVGFKQLGPGVETGVHGVQDEKRVWFEVELQGAQGNHETEDFSGAGKGISGWKIKTGIVLDSCNQMSTQQSMKSGFAKHLGVAWIQQQNELVDKTNVTLFAKVVLYMNMGFNESRKYKKTFIGSGVGTGSVQVLQGVEFEVKPQKDHTFEVEPHGNVDHVVGSQEVQTQDLIYYHPARDREHHLAWELFSYKEDINEAAFAVAAAELKDDMDARSDVYVLSNGCKKCSDDRDGYYWEYTPVMFIHLFLYIDDMGISCGCKAEIWATKGLLDKTKGNILGMNIVRDQSVGSQKYQMACTRPDIASADVGMLDGFDHGLQTDVQVFVDFDYTMGRSITATKEAIWLKGLAIEAGFELKIVAGIATRALSSARSSSILCVCILLVSSKYFVLDPRLLIERINKLANHLVSRIRGRRKQVLVFGLLMIDKGKEGE